MQPKNVLILADPGAGQTLSSMLEQQGYQVTVAPTNPAVVSAVRNAGYDLVIADLAGTRATEEVLPTLEEVERQHIERVLDQVRFNLSKASRILAIDRTTLYNKLKRFGFQRDSIRARRLAVQAAAPSSSASVAAPATESHVGA